MLEILTPIWHVKAETARAVRQRIRHIANAAVRSRIERACRRAGYEPPVICTPNELMEEDDHADETDGPNHR